MTKWNIFSSLPKISYTEHERVISRCSTVFLLYCAFDLPDRITRKRASKKAGFFVVFILIPNAIYNHVLFAVNLPTAVETISSRWPSQIWVLKKEENVRTPHSALNTPPIHLMRISISHLSMKVKTSRGCRTHKGWRFLKWRTAHSITSSFSDGERN